MPHSPSDPSTPGTTPPSSSLLKKRERDRRAQQNVRNKRTALVNALEQRITALETELQHERGACQGLRREVEILRGRQDAVQRLIGSWAQDNDDLYRLHSSLPPAQGSMAMASDSSSPSSLTTNHFSTRDESAISHKDIGMRGDPIPVPRVEPLVPPRSAALATTADGGLTRHPRWNMLPAHRPGVDVTVTNCYSSWLQRPDLARASPESPSPLELLYGSKKNFLANSIYERIRQWPCRDAERLALSWLTYHMIKWMVEPTEERFNNIPAFMHPVAEQLYHPHPYYADFILWPQVRANMVKHPDVYDNVDLVGMMSCCIKVRWPWNVPLLEPNDDHEFVLKPDFYRTFTDLNGWGLTKEFIDKFPLLVEGLDPSVRYEIGQVLA